MREFVIVQYTSSPLLLLKRLGPEFVYTSNSKVALQLSPEKVGIRICSVMNALLSSSISNFIFDSILNFSNCKPGVETIS